MKISELVVELNQFMEANGDVDVVVYDDRSADWDDATEVMSVDARAGSPQRVTIG